MCIHYTHLCSFWLPQKILQEGVFLGPTVPPSVRQSLVNSQILFFSNLEIFKPYLWICLFRFTSLIILGSRGSVRRSVGPSFHPSVRNQLMSISENGGFFFLVCQQGGPEISQKYRLASLYRKLCRLVHLYFHV